MVNVTTGSASLHQQINTNVINPAEKITKESKVQTRHSESTALHHDEVNAKDLQTAVTALNGFIDPSRTNLEFVYHEELNEYYVKVINPLTNETVKEIPPKKMLDMYAAMADFMGILVDRKI